MPEIILSDYFYGDESEEFVFFKIPRQLITNPKFKHVSTDAKTAARFPPTASIPPTPRARSSFPVSPGPSS